jgi:hypothetical protein
MIAATNNYPRGVATPTIAEEQPSRSGFVAGSFASLIK